MPIIADGGGRWHATLLENREELEGEDAVQAFEQAVIRRGYSHLSRAYTKLGIPGRAGLSRALEGENTRVPTL